MPIIIDCVRLNSDVNAVARTQVSLVNRTDKAGGRS